MSAMKSRPDKNPGDDKPKKGREKARPYQKGAAPVPYGFKKAKDKDWKKDEKRERSHPDEHKGKYSDSYKSFRDESRPRRSYDKRGETSGSYSDEHKAERRYNKPGETHSTSRDDGRPRRSFNKREEGSESSFGSSRPVRKFDQPEKRKSSVEDDHKPRRSWTDNAGQGKDEWQKRTAGGRKNSGFGSEKSGRSGDERPKRRSNREEDTPRKNFNRERPSTWKKEEAPRYKSSERRDDVKPYKRKSSGQLGRSGIEQPKGQKGFNADGTIRLNKYIANSGVCSRREADDLIIAGGVTVNGVVVTQLGTRITREDKVEFGGETLNIEKKVYLILNKPKGYITTVDDPDDRNTVMMLVKDACRERIYPVGRLDRNTTGLLLLTNDGEITKKLTHPSHRVRKVYHVELDKALTKPDMERLTEGIELEDGMMAVDEIAYTGKNDDKKNIGIVIHSGRNRIVRRLFEVLEYNVVKLDRVAFANLTKKDLPRGKWRMLDQNEINLLMMM